MRVPRVLRQLRAVHGYTYDEVEDRTGLSQQLLFDMEYKDRRLTLDQLILLAECYRVSAGDVLGIDGAEFSGDVHGSCGLEVESFAPRNSGGPPGGGSEGLGACWPETVVGDVELLELRD